MHVSWHMVVLSSPAPSIATQLMRSLTRRWQCMSRGTWWFSLHLRHLLLPNWCDLVVNETLGNACLVAHGGSLFTCAIYCYPTDAIVNETLGNACLVAHGGSLFTCAIYCYPTDAIWSLTRRWQCMSHGTWWFSLHLCHLLLPNWCDLVVNETLAMHVSWHMVVLSSPAPSIATQLMRSLTRRWQCMSRGTWWFSLHLRHLLLPNWCDLVVNETLGNACLVAHGGSLFTCAIYCYPTDAIVNETLAMHVS